MFKRILTGVIAFCFLLVPVVFFADTRKMRGAQAALDGRMLRELENVLGKENVVLH